MEESKAAGMGSLSFFSHAILRYSHSIKTAGRGSAGSRARPKVFKLTEDF